MSEYQDVGRIIRIVSNQLKRQFDNPSKRDTLTGMQGSLLQFILAHCNEKDIFQKDVEEEFNLRRSTATGILQLMEKKD